MAKIEHAPGTFVWAELQTTNGASAKKFYGELFGWELNDDPIPGGGTYTMIRHNDGNVGALFEQNEEMRKMGVPPHWASYVSVKNAAESAKKAGELGGTIIKDAFDVMDVGSMAVLQDPTGATFSLWQPKLHHGVEHVGGKSHTMVWNELATRDVDRAGKFYCELFGWKTEVTENGPMKYTMFLNGEERAGGMLAMNEQWGDIPPHWMVYFGVDDCDGMAEKAESLGGKISVPPTDIPGVGRFSVVTDAEGATFSIIKFSFG